MAADINDNYYETNLTNHTNHTNHTFARRSAHTSRPSSPC